MHPSGSIQWEREECCVVQCTPLLGLKLQCTHFTHDDGALDGQFEVLQGVAHQGDDPLHAVNLLPQEDIHRGQGTHLL